MSGRDGQGIPQPRCTLRREVPRHVFVDFQETWPERAWHKCKRFDPLRDLQRSLSGVMARIQPSGATFFLSQAIDHFLQWTVRANDRFWPERDATLFDP
jgi:hypothetical protein